jgi:hypothetical protein
MHEDALSVMTKTVLVSKKPTKADQELVNSILKSLDDFAAGRFDKVELSRAKR